MELQGLTTRQVGIANLMWACNTIEEVEAVVSVFGTDAALVKQMILLAALDEMIDAEDEFPEIVTLLESMK